MKITNASFDAGIKDTNDRPLYHPNDLLHGFELEDGVWDKVKAMVNEGALTSLLLLEELGLEGSFKGALGAGFEAGLRVAKASQEVQA